jgi:hypothetical protein
MTTVTLKLLVSNIYDIPYLSSSSSKDVCSILVDLASTELNGFFLLTTPESAHHMEQQQKGRTCVSGIIYNLKYKMISTYVVIACSTNGGRVPILGAFP